MAPLQGLSHYKINFESVEMEKRKYSKFLDTEAW